MNTPPKVIAEIGSNHGRSLETACKLIDYAKASGCSHVKFQLFFPDEFIPESVTASDYGLAEKYGDITWQKVLSEKLIFPHNLYPRTREYCKSLSIGFGVTVHGPRSLELAKGLDVDFIKVASMDLNYHQLLRMLSRQELPIILSTGMAFLPEIQKACDALEAKSKDVLMHCTSEYPACEKNISRVSQLKELGEFCLGYSDHTENSLAAVAAYCLGATWFEKHITLDKNMDGPDHSFAAEPSDLKKYVSDIVTVSRMFELSSTEELSSKELENRSVYRRSIVAAKDLSPGTIITQKDIDFKRPGLGFQPEQELSAVGRTVKEFIPKDAPLTYYNVEMDR